MTAADEYHKAEQTCGADPIEAGLIGSLTDHECLHGRLPNDNTNRCGCWPEEGAVLAAVDGDRQRLSPQLAREIIGLRRAGLSATAILVVVNRYFHAGLTYSQVRYYLRNARTAKPKAEDVIRDAI